MKDYLNSIAYYLHDINKHDMTKAEMQICNILIESGHGEWMKDEDGISIFRRNKK